MKYGRILFIKISLSHKFDVINMAWIQIYHTFFPSPPPTRIILTGGLTSFTKKSCKSAKQNIWRFVRTLGRWKNEDSRSLIIIYKERNYVPKFQDILCGRKHPKRQKSKFHGQNNTLMHAPSTSQGTWGRRLSNGSRLLAPITPHTCALHMAIGT